MEDPSQSIPVLVLLSGKEHGRRIPLTTGRTAVIGRSLQADLTFPDEPSLSRLHARIERTEAGYTLTDLGSVNGTYVNGHLSPGPTALEHADVIACGELEMRFEWGDTRRGVIATIPISIPIADAAEAALDPDATVMLSPLRVSALSADAPPPAAEAEHADVVAVSTDDAGMAAGGGADAFVAAPADATLAATDQVGPASADMPTPNVAVERPTIERHRPGTSLQATLATLPLFRGIGLMQLEALARTSAERDFATDEAIVRQGEPGESLFVVIEGEVRVSREEPVEPAATSGTEPPVPHGIALATIGAGGFFGEMSLLDGLPRSATVRALTPVRCIELPRWGLEGVIRDSPSVALEMLAVLSRRLRQVEHSLNA